MIQQLSTAQLATFILGSLKEETSGRVALYHYIKNFCRGDEAVNIELINDFFAECLLMNHWQDRRSELHQDIKELLVRFFSVNKMVISITDIWDLPRMQIFNLTQSENLYATIKNYENGLLKEAETLRIIPDGENRIVVLKRSAQGLLTVKTYNNLVRVQGNTLFPLTPDQQVTYNQLLELQGGVVQRLRWGANSQVRFELGDSGVIAQTLSGFAFRQNQIQKINHLSEFPALFFHLKRLEKFYVYRPSDPYYVELVNTLDKATHMLKTQDPAALTFARKTFESAQIAFDQIFPDDKVVYMRLKELAKYMTVQNKEVQV